MKSSGSPPPAVLEDLPVVVVVVGEDPLLLMVPWCCVGWKESLNDKKKSDPRERSLRKGRLASELPKRSGKTQKKKKEALFLVLVLFMVLASKSPK